jgi:hypothetical protein
MGFCCFEVVSKKNGKLEQDEKFFFKKSDAKTLKEISPAEYRTLEVR